MCPFISTDHFLTVASYGQPFPPRLRNPVLHLSLLFCLFVSFQLAMLTTVPISIIVMANVVGAQDRPATALSTLHGSSHLTLTRTILVFLSPIE